VGLVQGSRRPRAGDLARSPAAAVTVERARGVAARLPTAMPERPERSRRGESVRGGGLMRRVAPLRPNDPARLGGYQLAGRIGVGGQGVVYLAHDSTGQAVAIKTLHADFATDPHAAARFAKELAAARRVAPFCTAQVLDANVDPDQPYIVSEYVDGPSLHQAVRENGPHTGNALHRLAVATATALVAIHEANVVHRDFKPHNVLLGPDGPRVIDFGVARALDATATTMSRPMGTPAYMAPEQLGGETIGPATDVFAWGGVMVFAATASPAFGNDSIPAIIARIVSGKPTIDGLGGLLRELVETCLVKDPARRPTARQLLDALLGIRKAADAGDIRESHELAQPPGPEANGPAANGPPANGRPANGKGANGRAAASAPVPNGPAGEPAAPAAVAGRGSGGGVGSPTLTEARPGAEPSPVARDQAGVAAVERGDAGSPRAADRRPRLRPAASRRRPSRAPGWRTLAGAIILIAMLYVPDGQKTGGASVAAPPASDGARPIMMAEGLAAMAVGRLGDRPLALATGRRGSPTRTWDLAAVRQVGGTFTDTVSAVTLGRMYGRTAAVAAKPGDRTLRIWDAAAGSELRKPIPMAVPDIDYISSIAVAEVAGRPVALTGRDDGVLPMWDLIAGSPMRRLIGHTEGIASLAVGEWAGRPIAVSGSWDNTIRVWDLTTARQVGKPLIGHGGGVESVALGTLDGRTIVVSSSIDRTVRVWDVATSRPLGGPLVGHTGAVSSVAVGRLGRRTIAVSGSWDNTVRVWDITTRRPLGRPLTDHRDRIMAVGLVELRGMTMVVSAAGDGEIRVRALGPPDRPPAAE
jgi:hypothetical protein